MRFIYTGMAVLSLFGQLAITAPSDSNGPASVFKQISSLAPDDRADAYQKLPANLQESYWVGKFKDFFRAYQDLLDPTQLGALWEIVGSYTKLDLPTTEQFLTDEFGFDVAKTLLTTLDSVDDSESADQGKNSKRNAQPQCTCSIVSDWCEPKRCIGWNKLPPPGCQSSKTGCGTLLNHACNGICE